MTPRAPTGLVGREVELERIGAFFGREGVQSRCGLKA